MTGDIVHATNRVADAVRAQYASKASDAVIEVFTAAARHLQLSIPAGEIALVPYGDAYNIQITLEGRRTIAQRTGRLRGISPVEWCGPRRFDADGAKLPLDWEEVWTGNGNPYAARVFVAVDGWDHPANGTCKYDEFNQPSSPVWKKYPSHMLGNAAEKLALRRGFSAEIGKALADLAEITGDYRITDEDTDQPPPDPARHVALPQADGEPAYPLTCSCGEMFDTAWAFAAHRNATKPPTSPGEVAAPESPPGRPEVIVSMPARPPAAANHPTMWRDGTPMFDPQTGKPL